MDRLRNIRFVNTEFYNKIMKDNNALFNLLNVLPPRNFLGQSLLLLAM